MLELFVIPKQGNSGGRFFPHSGHLGVTPVILQGRIATKLPEVCEPLRVKSISLGIKCTESRTSGTSKVLWEKRKVIMTAPEGQEYMDMGDWESAFKTTIPVDAAARGRSATTIPDYKVVWRMDVIIEHKPIPYVGTSISRAFTLNLHNHRSPTIRPMSPPSPYALGPEGSTVNVCVAVQPGAFGPGDTLPVQLQVKPLDAGVTVKKATVILERHMEFLGSRNTSPTPTAAPLPSLSPTPAHSSSSSSSHPSGRLSGLFRSSHSPVRRGSDEEQGSSRRDKIAEVSSTDVVVDSSGTHWCQTSISLPRRHGNWDLGETQETDMVKISYSLKPSVTVRAPKSRSSRTFACAPVPVVIAATSLEERSAADKAASEPVSKKRHRSSRRGLYMHEGNIDVTDSATYLLPPSPILSPIKGVATDVKPILLPANHPGQAQSISFVFPPTSPPLAARDTNPYSIQSILNPASSSAASSPSPSGTPHLPSPPPTRKGIEIDSLDVWRQCQNTGRRISTTTSEEDEAQPSRSRQRTHGKVARNSVDRPALPSLDALGLGLPHVPDDDRPRSRPKTAPIHSTFSMTVPPPLSGALSVFTPFGQRPMTSMASIGDHAYTLNSTTAAGALREQDEDSLGPFAFAYHGTDGTCTETKTNNS